MPRPENLNTPGVVPDATAPTVAGAPRRRIAGEAADESIEACLEGPDDLPKFELADVAQYVSEL